MRELTFSHRTLRLLLTRRDQPGNLLISCLDPLRLAGPVYWSNSDIVIARAPLPEEAEDGFVVRDAVAGVEIVCGGLEVAENVKLYRD
jgi:hypothetical protein